MPPSGAKGASEPGAWRRAVPGAPGQELAAGLDNPDGYIFDNLAWGGRWDIDPRGVKAPTLLFYGTEDTRCSHVGHGGWYADRIRETEMVELQGETHFDVIDGHWREVLKGLLRIWT